MYMCRFDWHPWRDPPPKISKEHRIMLHIANMKQWFHVYLTLSSATHCKQQDTRQIDHFQVLDFELELSSLASPWCNEVVSKGKNLLRNKINFFFSFFLDARPCSVLIILHSFFNCFRWSQITHNEIFKTRLDKIGSFIFSGNIYSEWVLSDFRIFINFRNIRNRIYLYVNRKV